MLAGLITLAAGQALAESPTNNKTIEETQTLLCAVASTVVEARRLSQTDAHQLPLEEPAADISFQSVLMVIKDGWGDYLPPDDPEWANRISHCRNLGCLKSFIQEQTGQFMRCSTGSFQGYEPLQKWLHQRKLYSGAHTMLYLDNRLRVIRFDNKNTLVFSRYGRRDAARSIQALGLEKTSRTLWLGDIKQPGVLAIVPYNGLDQFIYPHQPVEPEAATPETTDLSHLTDLIHSLRPEAVTLAKHSPTAGQYSKVPEALAPVVTHVINGMLAGTIGHILLRPSRNRNIIYRTLINRSLTSHALMGGILFGVTGYMLWQGINHLDRQVPEWGPVTMAGWKLTTGTLMTLGSVLANQIQSRGGSLLKNGIRPAQQATSIISTKTDKK